MNGLCLARRMLLGRCGGLFVRSLECDHQARPGWAFFPFEASGASAQSTLSGFGVNKIVRLVGCRSEYVVVGMRRGSGLARLPGVACLEPA